MPLSRHKTKNILVTGGTGLIGSHLTKRLQDQGHNVSLLSRNPAKVKNTKAYYWNVEKNKIDNNCLAGIDTIIHLAGTGIADKKWTAQRKQEIVNSRVLSIKLLYRAMEETKSLASTIISASAVGYYGNRGDEILTEESKNGDGFLAACCKQWETAVDQGAKFNCRIVKIRIGILLTKDGGALSQLEKPVQYFAGAPLGTGMQWVPWIHIDDLLSIFIEALENPRCNGVYNACSNSPVTNIVFTKMLAKKLHRPVWPIKVPKIILQFILGERKEIVLISNRVSSQKIIGTGFQFQYPLLKDALTEMYS